MKNEIGYHLMADGTSPEAYLQELYSHTENGLLPLSRQENDVEMRRHYCCKMNWTEADLPELLKEHRELLQKLDEIAEQARQIREEEDCLPSAWIRKAVGKLLPHKDGCAIRAWLYVLIRQNDEPSETALHDAEALLLEALALNRFCTEKEWIGTYGDCITELVFDRFVFNEKYGEAALVKTKGPLMSGAPLGIPLCPVMNGYDDEFRHGDRCTAFVEAFEIFNGVKLYDSEEDLYANGVYLAVPTLIPYQGLGFNQSFSSILNEEPFDEDPLVPVPVDLNHCKKEMEETPRSEVLLVGKVMDAVLEGEEDGEYRYLLHVETKELVLALRCTVYEKKEIRPGMIVCGQVCLTATMAP